MVIPGAADPAVTVRHLLTRSTIALENDQGRVMSRTADARGFWYPVDMYGEVMMVSIPPLSL